MLLYTAVIFLSTLLFFVGDNSSNAFVKKIFVILSILISSFFAGFRDATVSIDAVAYGVPIFDHICRALSYGNIVDLFNEASIGGGAYAKIESGYLLLNIVAASVSNSINVLFFILQFAALLLVVYGISLFKEDVRNGTIVYFLYNLFFYCASFCFLRQSIVMALLFVICYYLIKREIVPYMFLCVVAFFFHHSAIILIPLYFIPNMVRVIPRYYQPLLLLFGLSLYYVFPLIIPFLSANGIIDARFAKYANMSYQVHKIDMLFYLLLYFLAFFCGKRLQNRIMMDSFEYVKNAKALSIIGLCMTLCGIYNDVASRMAMYVVPTIIYSFLMLETKSCNRCKFGSINRISFALILIFVLYYVYKGAVTGFGIVPYKSKILGL